MCIRDRCGEQGINILDCWMPEPNVRSNIGAAIRGKRERWFIQGHLGSTWQNGQYVRTRDMEQMCIRDRCWPASPARIIQYSFYISSRLATNRPMRSSARLRSWSEYA